MRLSVTVLALTAVVLSAFSVEAQDSTTDTDAKPIAADPNKTESSEDESQSSEQIEVEEDSAEKSADELNDDSSVSPSIDNIDKIEKKDILESTENTGSAQNDAKKSITFSARTTLGLSPGAPDLISLPGGVTPAFGSRDADSKDWRFEFHGMVFMPLRFGINKRENPGSNQKRNVLHAPPRVPGDFETFGYTSVVPHPWNQLNFSYGNNTVAATVIVAARTVTSANGYFDPPDMMGINDAFLTFSVPTKSEKLKLQMNFGSFADRYGYMGEYDMGRYGTPLIARVSGTGLTGTGIIKSELLSVMLEAGFKGQFGKAPVGVEPAGWNGFADPNVGSSYAGHGHVSINVKGKAEIGVHVVDAFTRDDRASNKAETPDGRILTVGPDFRLTMGRYGHFYTGYAYTDAETARSVSGVIRILNAAGGPGLMNEYLGADSDGTGALHTFGWQYDLSLGNLLRYPDYFEGNGSDLLISTYGIFTNVKSPNDAAHDGVSKLKLGAELGYSALKWLALNMRYDHVMPVTGEGTTYHSIITGRVIFHSDWNSRDQVALQYSYFNCGSASVVREGYPPADNPTIVPDSHVLSLTATLWW